MLAQQTVRQEQCLGVGACSLAAPGTKTATHKQPQAGRPGEERHTAQGPLPARRWPASQARGGDVAISDRSKFVCSNLFCKR